MFTLDPKMKTSMRTGERPSFAVDRSRLPRTGCVEVCPLDALGRRGARTAIQRRRLSLRLCVWLVAVGAWFVVGIECARAQAVVATGLDWGNTSHLIQALFVVACVFLFFKGFATGRGG